MTRPEPSAKSSGFGSGNVIVAGAIASSAKPPIVVAATTSSPAATGAASGAARHTPAPRAPARRRPGRHDEGGGEVRGWVKRPADATEGGDGNGNAGGSDLDQHP